MTTDFGLAQVSQIFDDAYDKPISESVYPLWHMIFQKVGDADLVKAAYQLVLKRQKTNKVSPGEMRGVLEEIGIHLGEYKASTSFKDDPAVRALNSHYEATEAMEGITLAVWLKQEGLSSFQEAMDRYGDRPSATERFAQVTGKQEKIPF